jgi:hypothetical protein
MIDPVIVALILFTAAQTEIVGTDPAPVPVDQYAVFETFEDVVEYVECVLYVAPETTASRVFTPTIILPVPYKPGCI